MKLLNKKNHNHRIQINLKKMMFLIWMKNNKLRKFQNKMNLNKKENK